ENDSVYPRRREGVAQAWQHGGPDNGQDRGLRGQPRRPGEHSDRNGGQGLQAAAGRRLPRFVPRDGDRDYGAGPRAARRHLRVRHPRGRPQPSASRSAGARVALPRRDYEDLPHSAVARKAEAALAAGREELLTAAETAALLAAPAPLAFWRKKRGKTQTQLAA